MSMFVDVPNWFEITSVIAIAISTVTSATPRWRRRRRGVRGVRDRPAPARLRYFVRNDQMCVMTFIGRSSGSCIRIRASVDELAVRDPRRILDVIVIRTRLGNQPLLAVGLRGVPGVLPLEVAPVPVLELDAE